MLSGQNHGRGRSNKSFHLTDVPLTLHTAGELQRYADQGDDLILAVTSTPPMLDDLQDC